jgi:hypothetical protein
MPRHTRRFAENQSVRRPLLEDDTELVARERVGDRWPGWLLAGAVSISDTAGAADRGSETASHGSECSWYISAFPI